MQAVIFNMVEKLDFRTKESYKTLRTNLDFSGKDRKVISVTSCTPNEGKTSVSLQLALSIAESNKKVILVDADLRKSVLKGRYKTSTSKYGLSHYLSGQNSIAEILCKTNVPNFFVIFAGPVPPNPSELLGNDSFRLLMEYLRKEYDYVIVDTPPLGSVIDSAVATQYCDGAVLVIESGVISYKFAQKVKEQLQKVGCQILGVVLNKVNMSSTGYYGVYYGKYYGKYYGNEDNDSLHKVIVQKGKKETKNNGKKGRVEERKSESDEILSDDMIQLDTEMIPSYVAGAKLEDIESIEEL